MRVVRCKGHDSVRDLGDIICQVGSRLASSTSHGAAKDFILEKGGVRDTGF